MMMMMMMISLYRKSVHSLLSLTDTVSPKSCPDHHQPHNYSKLQQAADDQHGLGLGLISDYNNLMQFKSPNILQSSSVLTKPLSPPRKDPTRVGFIDGGSVDGLMSCTESLGFESSDERLVSDDMMAVEDGGGTTVRVRRRTVVERKFPPPLSTLNHHGHPNFYLRPVRKDGRLELTKVRIERTDVLRACRGDGRLRLHLIKDDRRENVDDCEDSEKIEDLQEEELEVEGFVKEEKMEFRRCVEGVNQQRRREHHHQHLDVWRQHCLTTT